ncbi:nucleolar protein 6 Mat89Ba [Oratosquilla oratoria]|uniref:nucleolar protein 6 Mat89Ba n=1 Tax=Oratosquilla oratoria TaxID=337810 RepID=UPI003F765F65
MTTSMDQIEKMGSDAEVPINDEDGEASASDEDEDDIEDYDSMEESGDSEDDGFDLPLEEEGAPGKRKHKAQDGPDSKMAKGLHQVPTVEEMTALRETQTLFHSNLFKLQMEELLQEVSMNTKHQRTLDGFIREIEENLKNIESSEQFEITDLSWLPKGVANPFLEDLKPTKGVFRFVAPKEICVVGSYGTKTLTTQNGSVDLMLVMPKECVQNGDWCNQKWLRKRALYLAYLAGYLKDKTNYVLSWTHHCGHPLRPTLQVEDESNHRNKWKVVLHVVPPHNHWKVSRFSPEKGNLRLHWYYPKKYSQPQDTGPATPDYNWACAVDVVMGEHQQALDAALSLQPSLIEGVKLIKVWLHQRGMGSGLGGFGGHLVSMFVLHLLNIHKINIQSSGYQVFRSALVALSTGDWTTEGLSMAGQPPEGGPTLQQFHEAYEVVFVDNTGFVNLAAMLSRADFCRLKHEAGRALQVLDRHTEDNFEMLFISRVDFLQSFDQILCIKLNKEDIKNAIRCSPQELEGKLMDNGGDLRRPGWASILTTLRNGLGERVVLLATKNNGSAVWPLEECPPVLETHLTLGLLLDPVHAIGLLTKGPASETPEAGVFQSFWGDKCSLRRFQDGSFHEAVLWAEPTEPVSKRRLISGAIVKYLLSRHFSINKVHYVASQLEEVIGLPQSLVDIRYGTGEESTSAAIKACDSLSRVLRSLELPLSITSINPTSDVHRHARVFPPLGPHKRNGKKKKHLTGFYSGCMLSSKQPIDVLVFLEVSGKWPDDIKAVQAVKAQFYLEMAKQLSKHQVETQASPQHLYIIWEGYIFRIEIGYRKEIYLRRLVENPEGDYKEQDTESSMQLEKRLEMIPRLTSAIASVQSSHPSFSCTVRLSKYWVASQMLSCHMPDLATELLVAHLYLNPGPHSAPATPHVGFLRFLQLLAHCDWTSTPILVNLNDEFLIKDLAEIQRRFSSQRSVLPAMFIATPFDMRGPSEVVDQEDKDKRYKLLSSWTKANPSLQIIYRLKQLAAAALKFIDINLLSGKVDMKTIFKSSMNIYDVVINLSEKVICETAEANDNQTEETMKVKPPLLPQKRKDQPGPVLNPIQHYARILTECYGDYALFFRNELNGPAVGVVWRPKITEPEPFKVNKLCGHLFSGVKEVEQVPNIPAFLEDFEVLGQGFVTSVTTKS